MITINIGKAKIRIYAEGCIDCGTLFSTGWREASEIQLVVRGRRKPFLIVLNRCENCQHRKRKR